MSQLSAMLAPIAPPPTLLGQMPPGPNMPDTVAALAGAWPLTALDAAFAQFVQATKPSADPRHLMLAALVSHQYGRGHACLDLLAFTQFGVTTLGWDTRLQPLMPTDLASAAATLPWILGVNSPLVLDGGRLYLRRNWQAEQTIRQAIMARLNAVCHVPTDLASALDSLFAPSDAPLAAFSNANLDATQDALPGAIPDTAYNGQRTTRQTLRHETFGQKPSTQTPPDWQKVACALAARGRFTLITGGPGTGKTTTVVRLLGLLQSSAVQRGKPLRIALAAPTGKAAARLGESIAQAVQKLPSHMQAHIPSQAQTLHKLLQLRSSAQPVGLGTLALDLVVVDEASMIDLELMARLLAAVPLSASLILLGDKDQLASVEAGAVMGQLCAGAEQGAYTPDTLQWVRAQSGQDLSAWQGSGSQLAQHTVMLRESRRFTADSPIGQWASAVNTGQRRTLAALWHAAPIAAPVSMQDEAMPAVTQLTPPSVWDPALASLVRRGWQHWLQLLETLQPCQPDAQTDCTDAQAGRLLRAFAEFQVLCAVREGAWGVQALNRSISQALGFAPQGWYAGRPVMVTRNDYQLDLMNGDIGLCLPTPQGLRVAFAQGRGLRWVLASRLDAVETVFAMTVHKSQGSEFDHVALVLPNTPAPVLTRELLYTGITRAKQRLTLVVPNTGVLMQAAGTQILRSGGLIF